jgi:hypothetical protein
MRLLTVFGQHSNKHFLALFLLQFYGKLHLYLLLLLFPESEKINQILVVCILVL